MVETLSTIRHPLCYVTGPIATVDLVRDKLKNTIINLFYSRNAFFLGTLVTENLSIQYRTRYQYMDIRCWEEPVVSLYKIKEPFSTWSVKALVWNICARHEIDVFLVVDMILFVDVKAQARADMLNQHKVATNREKGKLLVRVIIIAIAAVNSRIGARVATGTMNLKTIVTALFLDQSITPKKSGAVPVNS